MSCADCWHWRRQNWDVCIWRETRRVLAGMQPRWSWQGGGQGQRIDVKGACCRWGGEEEEEEHTTATLSLFAAEREGWERRIVDVKLERDMWMAWQDRLIATNLELMATIELLARDSDWWQTKCAASAEHASEVANERDGLAREVDVGMLMLADVQGSAKPTRPSARGCGTRMQRSRRWRGGSGQRLHLCGGGYGRPRRQGGRRRPRGGTTCWRRTTHWGKFQNAIAWR
jgi:hypothetical protein